MNMFTTAAKVQSPTAASDDGRKIAPDFRSGLGLAMRAGIFSGLVGPPIGLAIFFLTLLSSALAKMASASQPEGTAELFSGTFLIATWGLGVMLPLMAIGAVLGLIAGLSLGIPLGFTQSYLGRRLPRAVWILSFGLFGLLSIPVAFDFGPGGVSGWSGIPGIAPYSWFGLLGGMVGSAMALRMEALRDGRILPRPWFTPGKPLWFGSRGLGHRRLRHLGLKSAQLGGSGLAVGGHDEVGHDSSGLRKVHLGASGLDTRWLDRWSDLLAWSPEANPTLESKYMVDDHHEAVLFENATPALLAAAGAELLRYRFYPPQVADALGQYALEDREARDGDRVLQRLRILRAFGLPVLDILSMVEVQGIEAGPERWAFAYVTTERHPGRGWWRVALDLDAQERLRLTMTASSAPAFGRISGLPGIRAVYRRIMRCYQGRAHRRGIAAFRARVQGLADAGQVGALTEAAGSLDSAVAASAAKTAGPNDARLGEDSS
jgi:hypothetical protein